MNIEAEARKMYDDMKSDAQSKYFLYRHFDQDGTLLYIGISLSAISRLGQHKLHAPWFRNISSVTVEKFLSRTEALKAEKDAIQKENPLYNKAHVPSRKKYKFPSSEGQILLFRQERYNRNKSENLDEIDARLEPSFEIIWKHLGWELLSGGRHRKIKTGEIVGA